MKTEFKTIIILFCNKLRETLSEESLQKTREFLNGPESFIFRSSKDYWDFKAEILSEMNFSKLEKSDSDEFRFSLVVQVVPQLMCLWNVSELDKVSEFFRLHKMNTKLEPKEASAFGVLEHKAEECIKTINLTTDEHQLYKVASKAHLDNEFLALCASEKLNKTRVKELTDVLDDVLSLLPKELLTDAGRNLEVKEMTERRRVIDSYSYSPSEIEIEKEKRRLSVEFYGGLIALVKGYRDILKDNPME